MTPYYRQQNMKRWLEWWNQAPNEYGIQYKTTEQQRTLTCLSINDYKMVNNI